MADPPIAPAAAAAAPPQPPSQAPNDAQPPPQQPPSVSGAALATPPPRSVIASGGGSAVSSLTSRSTAAALTTPMPSRKRPADPLSSPEESSPSPKRPDFSRPPSDDNSLKSGADSEDWGEEEARIMAAMEKQNMEEEAAEEADDDKIEGTYDWEGTTEEVMDEQAEATEVEYETVQVTNSRAFGVGFLKGICDELKIPKSGKKGDIFDRIRDFDSARISKISDIMFEYQKVKQPEGDVPKWVVLSGKPVADVEGIDMETGAQHGFYGPTNKENAVGPQKMEYLTGEGEKIKRPAFRKKPRKKKTTAEAPADTNAPGPNPSRVEPPLPAPPERGGASDYAKKKIGNLKTARPKDFFDLMLSPQYVKSIVAMTNARAAAEGAGAGGTTYTDFVPFDVPEMYKFFGLLICNGLSPKPSIDLWFLEGKDHPIWGNDHIAPAMDKILPNGKKIKGYRRWKHFRAFLALYDTRLNIQDEVKKNPLFKVKSLIDELNHNAKRCWRTGKWVSVDEQTLGFKGKHGCKLRISYKREGDGFQCDALCDEGYTFSVWFRHGDAPTLPAAFAKLDLSPTARRVIWLVLRLPNAWTSIFMDNLFNSRKLFTALYQSQALGHGVVRLNGRGFCEQVVQSEEKTKSKAEALRGTTKAARLVNCAECPDMLSVSVYDTKPVHLLSTVSEDVHWVEKKRKVWSAVHKEMKLIGFLRLNFIDDYNNGMNYVDMSDQLRNQYRPDHWLRNRKWWWAFLFWGKGVAGTNAWKLYDKMYDEELGNGKKLPPKWDHREFLVQLVYDLIFPSHTANHVSELEAMDDETMASTMNTMADNSSFGGLVGIEMEMIDFTTESGRAEYLTKTKPYNITKPRLEKNYWPRRLDGRRHPTIPCGWAPACQFCNYQWNNIMNSAQQEVSGFMKRNRADVRRCLVCNVNLCHNCEHEFHGIELSNTAAMLGRKL